MYDSSEMAQAQAQEVQAEVEQPQQPPQQPEKPRPTADEKRRMGEVADIAASVGIDRDEARRYIWGLYQANGMTSVEGWASAITPQQPEPEPEPDASYEVAEPELYGEDIDF